MNSIKKRYIKPEISQCWMTAVFILTTGIYIMKKQVFPFRENKGKLFLPLQAAGRIVRPHPSPPKPDAWTGTKRRNALQKWRAFFNGRQLKKRKIKNEILQEKTGFLLSADILNMIAAGGAGAASPSVDTNRYRAWMQVCSNAVHTAVSGLYRTRCVDWNRIWIKSVFQKN